MTQVSDPAQAGTMQSDFSIPKLDCPSEENLIRLALGDLPQVQSLSFDLPARALTVVHTGDAAAVLARLQPLKLGASLAASMHLAVRMHTTSVFGVPKMDCPSEENLIRLALQDVDTVSQLQFDLARRQLRISHSGSVEPILNRLTRLELGAQLLESTTGPAASAAVPDAAGDAAEAKTLRMLLAINGIMFVIELIWGWIAQSTGLVADSLDMFADAAVYGLALYAVGRAAQLKTRAAHLAGWLQLLLALGALCEVIRRTVFGSEPESTLMIGVGAVALVANVSCLVLIAKKRDRGTHMKASYIFSANDVLANLGVIVAGALVHWTGSPYPDLVIGTAIGLIVINGARRILQLK